VGVNAIEIVLLYSTANSQSCTPTGQGEINTHSHSVASNGTTAEYANAWLVNGKNIRAKGTEKDTGYSLRPRSHHLTLPFTDNNMIRKNFLHIKLFMDTY